MQASYKSLKAAIRSRPATVAVIALWAIFFVLCWAMPEAIEWLGFDPSLAASRPWTFITHIFVTLSGMWGALGLFLAGWWVWFCGGITESDIGSAKFAAFCLAFGLAASLSLLAGSLFLHVPIVYSGAFLLLEGVTVLWATRRPTAPILLYGLIPLQARWVAVLGVAAIAFSVPPVACPFLLIPLALSWLFAARFWPTRKPVFGSSPTKEYRKNWKEGDAFRKEAHARKKEREERERLRKLFESSLKDDSEES